MNINIAFSCCHRRAVEGNRVQEVEPAPEPAPAKEPSPAEDSATEAEAEEVEFRRPVESELQGARFYCVWKLSSGSPEWKGIHWGPGRTAYEGILRLNGGHFGGLRWKRADSYLEATPLYESKRAESGEAAGGQITYYLWK